MAGSGALVSHRLAWEDESGSPYAVRFLDYWHADRDKSRAAGKHRHVESPSYSDEDLERIDQLYANETRRGATPLLVGDVAVGDTLGPIVKGPMTVSDIVYWHAGIGMGDLGLGALKLSYKNRQRMPGFYKKDRFGAWDAAIRVHWDQSAAARVGQPESYDYGFMRTNWMVHLITNWMGDDAWIWQLSFAVKKFNYIGDVHYVSGTVREVDPLTNRVTVDVALVNQRDETTALRLARSSSCPSRRVGPRRFRHSTPRTYPRRPHRERIRSGRVASRSRAERDHEVRIHRRAGRAARTRARVPGARVAGVRGAPSHGDPGRFRQRSLETARSGTGHRRAGDSRAIRRPGARLRGGRCGARGGRQRSAVRAVLLQRRARRRCPRRLRRRGCQTGLPAAPCHRRAARHVGGRRGQRPRRSRRVSN